MKQNKPAETKETSKLLQSITDKQNMEKLSLCDETVINHIYKAALLMQPKSIFINRASKDDLRYIREMAIREQEEQPLSTPGHTIHFDGVDDQGRDTNNTRYLAFPESEINSLQKKKELQSGIKEVEELMQSIMKDKEMIVSFISRGPIGCPVSDPTLQITDSYYVTHSEDILYRMVDPRLFSEEVKEKGYLFVNLHSAGKLDDNHVCANIEQRRIYMDVENFYSYSCNNQYAGNSIAPKKINHRFANMNNIRNHFGKRLDEHMFITGFDVNGETIYFAGAYPSGCGKTGTAMTGSHLIGDDLAKIFIDEQSGEVRAVNPEKGMFGIIEGVNPANDPELIESITNKSNEVIFSNILVQEGKPYWTGMGQELPDEGENYTGKWQKTTNRPPSHKNSRFTIPLSSLRNYDPLTEHPAGVKISGLLFGGRDYKTMPTILMAHDWPSTVVHGAIIRSATTATEIGADGSEKRSPFANEAFFPAPLGHYINHYLEFGKNPAIKKQNLPSGFQVNYWLHKSNRYKLENGEQDGLIGEKRDTKVWMMAMAMMHRQEMATIWTPIGKIPDYNDLQLLFKNLINKSYPEETYKHQFSLYTEEIIKRLETSVDEFSREKGICDDFFQVLDRWIADLNRIKKEIGKIISPQQMKEYGKIC